MPPRTRLAEVTSQRDALEQIAKLIRAGSVNGKVLQAAKALTMDCDARDDLCEVESVYEAVKTGDSRVPGLARGMRYVSDPRSYDTFYSAPAMLDQCEQGSCAGDCLPLDTLVLRRDLRLVPLDEIAIGDVIMGDGQWTKVTNRWEKGEKDLLGIRLNNGSILRVTEEHRLFRVPRVNESGNRVPSATLSGPRESAEEVRAGEVRPGDDLLTGQSIPTGVESLDPDLAWLLGVYIADGWYEELKGQPYRCAISGRDGYPKEAQKRRVQEIAAARGWATRWHERYLAVNDAEATCWLAAVGKGAERKHVPSLNYNEPTIRAILSGLAADAFTREDGTRTFGTISPLLAIQLRVMFHMLGQSTSVRRVDDHGGFGSHPIYRVTPRKNSDTRADGKHAKTHARVKAIGEIESAPCMDIETDTGRFYLPESDLVVHNCDDSTILIGSLLASLGYMVGARAWGPGSSQSDDYQHVYCVVAIPKSGPWPKNYYGHGLDVTVHKSFVGWEPPGGHIMTAWVD